MVRILFSVVVPIVLPTALYFLYAWFVARRARAAGVEVDKVDVPWSWLAAAGVALLLLSLMIEFVYGGYAPGREYTPAHMEGGKLVPGETK
jgi:hypothetical protein